MSVYIKKGRTPKNNICSVCGERWDKYKRRGARGMCSKCYDSWYHKQDNTENSLRKKKKCKEEGCNELEYRKGLCYTHFWKWYRQSDKFKAYIKRKNERLSCVICGKPVKCKNLCPNHYLSYNLKMKLSYALRKRVRSALKSKNIKKNHKNGNISSLIGCDIDFLKKHIESMFLENMSWDNWGSIKNNNRAKWHIDHIIPLSSFDLSDLENIKKANHYSNLRPLWAEDNLKKGTRKEKTNV